MDRARFPPTYARAPCVAELLALAQSDVGTQAGCVMVN
jgi:hypothetical protein